MQQTFVTRPSKLGSVVSQMENQTESRKNQCDHILQVRSRQKKPNLKLYGETQSLVKFLGITFDSQLTFQKRSEDILDRRNIRYHRLKLLVNQSGDLAHSP